MRLRGLWTRKISIGETKSDLSVSDSPKPELSLLENKKDTLRINERDYLRGKRSQVSTA